MSVPETKAPRRRSPGRPSKATREDVVELALTTFAKGERVDLRRIATELEISRTTIYRWFGSRERLIGEVLVIRALPLLKYAQKHTNRTGAMGLLDTFDLYNRSITGSRSVRAFVARERDAAVRVITDGTGVVQPRLVEWITDVIRTEVDAGRYKPAIEPETLGYAIVRLAEAFLFIDTTAGIDADVDALCEVEAALLGIPDPHLAAAELGRRT